jgi:hypothetical protein
VSGGQSPVDFGHSGPWEGRDRALVEHGAWLDSGDCCVLQREEPFALHQADHIEAPRGACERFQVTGLRKVWPFQGSPAR